MKDNLIEFDGPPRLGYVTIKVAPLERFVTWVIAIISVAFTYPPKELKQMAILRPGEEGYENGLPCKQVGGGGENKFWEV